MSSERKIYESQSFQTEVSNFAYLLILGLMLRLLPLLLLLFRFFSSLGPIFAFELCRVGSAKVSPRVRGTTPTPCRVDKVKVSPRLGGLNPTALLSEPQPPPNDATDTSTTSTSEPYKYVSAQGFEVSRPNSPNPELIKSLPRRLLVTTFFLTLPLTFLSNFLELTSKLIISSPIPAISNLAASLNLNEFYPDGEGYKLYKSPSRSSQPVPYNIKRTPVRYSLLIPPRFVQDPAVALANSQLSDPNREMRMARSSAKDTVPDVAWGPMGMIDPVTKRSSSDVNLR